MSDSSLSNRQRSVDSDSSNQMPSAKRKKSLDTQRAFRARKAAYLSDLEHKVAIQDLEIARLKRENQTLHARVARLEAYGRAASSATATGCCGANEKPREDTHTTDVNGEPTVLKPLPSVLQPCEPASSVSMISCAST